jgi:hypothetical protein
LTEVLTADHHFEQAGFKVLLRQSIPKGVCVMMRITNGFVLLAICIACAASQGSDDKSTGGLLLITQDGKYGYIDRTGKEVIAPRFDYAMNFSDGTARVQVGDKWTYINEKGELLGKKFDKPFRFQDKEYDFAEGMAAYRIGGKEKRTPDGYHTVVVGGRYGYIDKSGAIVIQVSFDGAGSFCEGLAAVKTGDKWGYIDKQGRTAIRPQFDLAKEFKRGLARVVLNGKWGFINNKG